MEISLESAEEAFGLAKSEIDRVNKPSYVLSRLGFFIGIPAILISTLFIEVFHYSISESILFGFGFAMAPGVLFALYTVPRDQKLKDKCFDAMADVLRLKIQSEFPSLTIYLVDTPRLREYTMKFIAGTLQFEYDLTTKIFSWKFSPDNATNVITSSKSFGRVWASAIRYNERTFYNRY